MNTTKEKLEDLAKQLYLSDPKMGAGAAWAHAREFWGLDSSSCLNDDETALNDANRKLAARIDLVRAELMTMTEARNKMAARLRTAADEVKRLEVYCANGTEKLEAVELDRNTYRAERDEAQERNGKAMIAGAKLATLLEVRDGQLSLVRGENKRLKGGDDDN